VERILCRDQCYRKTQKFGDVEKMGIAGLGVVYGSSITKKRSKVFKWWIMQCGLGEKRVTGCEYGHDWGFRWYIAAWDIIWSWRTKLYTMAHCWHWMVILFFSLYYNSCIGRQPSTLTNLWLRSDLDSPDMHCEPHVLNGFYILNSNFTWAWPCLFQYCR